MTSTTTIWTSSQLEDHSLLRVDSPLNSSPRQSPESHTYLPTNTMATVSKTPGPNRLAARRQAQTAASDASTLRFFVVDHPTKLKDKHQLTANRKHVMQDYLSKERRKPSSTDARVTGSATGKKRKRMEVPVPETSINSSLPATIFANPQSSVPQLSRVGTEEVSPAPRKERSSLAKVKTVPRRPIIFADDLSPLIHGASDHSQYMSTTLDNVPDPIASIGSGLNPFDTWPKMSDPLMNIEQLKWNCSRNFGTRGIAAHWVPTLLKAKHAFLSTLCISSSHEDIMRRGLLQPHERHPSGSIERWKVRGEVISMINDAMRDPELRSTDATIVAVLHLLNSEMMGCDGSTMAVHQRGLHNMISERGGLAHLGVDGQLASILTITMYIISALRETEPHSDFVRFAEAKAMAPPMHQRTLPESPVYCRPSGYITIRRAIPAESPILNLLEDLRSLTNEFVTTSADHNRKGTQVSNLQFVHYKIWSTKPSKDHPQNFPNTRDQDRFDALRLVAQVYSHALLHQLPLSKAASQLASQHGGTSWHIRIKETLIHTDLSDCWGHLAGVLFWMTLVAGACANPDSPSNKPRRELSQEEEEARKWLAAIAVRCSIVLSFEYGSVILQSLKMMVGIEQALARFDADREGREVERIVVGGVQLEDVSPGVFGPVERPLSQRTFQDFARDFLEDCT